MEPLVIQMTDRDNVAIVANDGGLPPGTTLPGGLVLKDQVPQGHKVSLVDLTAGDAVLRYGVTHRPRAARHRGRPLGARAPARPARSASGSRACRWPSAKPPALPPLEGYSFQGYRNADGSVGTRNLLAITTTVQCVAGVVEHRGQAHPHRTAAAVSRTSTTWWGWSTATAAAWRSTRPTR